MTNPSVPSSPTPEDKSGVAPSGWSRRTTVVAGLGVAAAAALVGWRAQVWLQSGGGWGETGHSDEAHHALWSASFEQPEGQTLDMSSLKGRPLVLNFWATWCQPCIAEMPLLDAYFKQNAAKGVQVLGLAIDQPSAVRHFLSLRPVSYPIGLAGMLGPQLSKDLGDEQGGLPFTLVLGANGGLLHRHLGRLHEADVAAWQLA